MTQQMPRQDKKGTIPVKKYFALLLTGLLALSVWGCSAQETTAETSGAASAVQQPESTPAEALDPAVVVSDDAAAETGEAPHIVSPAEIGIHPDAAEDYTENVLRSSAAHVRDSDIYLAYKSQLVRAPLDENGEIQEAEVLMNVMPTINSLAGDADNIYLATNDGIFALPADTLRGAELRNGLLLSDLDTSTSPFYIWNDWLFFLYDGAVYVVPKAGGAEEILEEGVADFQVTNRGLFCTNENGALKFLSFEDGSEITLTGSDCSGRITFLLDTAYITTGQAEPRLYAYDAPERQMMEIVLTNTLSATHGVWTEPGALVCQTEDGRVVLYDLGANSETELGEYDMPYYEQGELTDGILYNMSGDELSWMHLDTGETGFVALPDLLPAQIPAQH